jgi:AcrR family transcriptional regulator
VAGNQRARLYGAMIESVDRRGYAATTVAEVSALAGVSRRAFYEQFSNKEDCFLATYDHVVARARRLVLEAWARERGWGNRLHAACKALLDDMAAEAKPARLVLVHSLGAGPGVRERMQLAGHVFERLAAAAFSSAPQGPELPRMSARAIVAGVRHVAAVRLRDRREAELSTLTDEVLDWSESYRSPHMARLGLSAAPAAVPTQRERTTRFLSAGDTRAVALIAFVHLALSEGYTMLSDPQIAQFAGLSTEVFHRHFPSREHAFKALLGELAAEALESVRKAGRRAASWPESVHAGIAAFADYLVSHEPLTRMAFIESFAAGPATVDRMTAMVDELTSRLIAGGPEPLRAPLIVEEAVAGAIWGVIAGCVLNNRLGRLPGLVDHMSFLALAPYLGPERAFDAVRASRPPGPAD